MQDTVSIEKTLSFLVCPSTGGRLLYDKEGQNLISPIGKLSYPIKNNIPIMIIEEATALNDEQVEAYLKKLK